MVWPLAWACATFAHGGVCGEGPTPAPSKLPAILAQRIAILDGAMGTMIQRFKLTEAQYRASASRTFRAM
jgi:hypothetical protein